MLFVKPIQEQTFRFAIEIGLDLSNLRSWKLMIFNTKVLKIEGFEFLEKSLIIERNEKT